jgi:hypothetical protein
MSLDKLLIGFESLTEVLETAFFTAPLAGTVPTSIMLVGPPGTGKSKSILQFSSPSLHVTNDITSSGIAEILENDKEGNIRHVVIPDFNIVVSHKQTTSALTVATLLTVMSEGIARIDDGRRKKDIVHAPIGIITAMTKDMYEDSARKFLKLGVGRRFCYLFFSYCFNTKSLVNEQIANGEVTLQQLMPSKLSLPDVKEWPLTIVIREQEADLIKAASVEMASNLSYQPKWQRDDEGTWVIKPFRGHDPINFTPHMMLRTMAQGHALRDKRMIVNEADIFFLNRFVSFTNYSLPVQL